MIQGIVDWLPISSEGTLVLAQSLFLNQSLELTEMIQVALFLHLGSLLAVIVYFWKDIWKLCKVFFNYKNTTKKDKAFLNFLIISSLVTAVLGYSVFKLLELVQKEHVNFTGQIIMLMIGFLLLATSFIQRKAEQKKDQALKDLEDLTIKDALIAGTVQSFAVLPGLSRSGSTVSTLLLLKIKDTVALKASFFMALPVILGGNILLNYKFFTGGIEKFVGLIVAFIFGIITVHFLFKIAEKLSFVKFTLFFGSVIVLLSIFSMFI